MKKLLLLLIIPFLSFGQGWEKTYTPNEINNSEFDYLGVWCGRQTSDEGYIIFAIGYRESSCGYFTQPIIIKLDSDGDEEWIKILGGDEPMIYGNDQTSGWSGGNIIETADGGYAFTAPKTIFDDKCFGSVNDVVRSPLVKLFENGYEEWVQFYSTGIMSSEQGFSVMEHDWFTSIQQSSDNGYLIGAETVNSVSAINGSSNNNTIQSCIIKTDINGIEQWRHTLSSYSWSWIIDEEEYEMIYNVEVVEVDDGYVAVELKQNTNFMYSVVTKINSNGEVLWYTNLVNNPIMKIEKTSNGGFICSGGQSLVKLNSNGSEEWTQTFDGAVTHAMQTSDGGYIGIINAGDNIAQLIKMNNNGAEEWLQTYDLNGNMTIDQTLDNGYVIFGRGDVFGEICIIKTNEFGNITSTIELPNPTSNRELVKTTNILGQENITIKNQPLLDIYNDGSVEKKYLIK